jgi:hypothetical protein
MLTRRRVAGKREGVAMSLVKTARVGIVGSMLLLAVGMVLQVGGAENASLVLGCLYGASVLIAGVALAAGYGIGRWPQPEEVNAIARSKTARHAALWATLVLVVMIAPRAALDGVGVNTAAAELAMSTTKTAVLPLASGIVGYVIGRMTRHRQSMART